LLPIYPLCLLYIPCTFSYVNELILLTWYQTKVNPNPKIHHLSPLPHLPSIVAAATSILSKQPRHLQNSLTSSKTAPPPSLRPPTAPSAPKQPYHHLFLLQQLPQPFKNQIFKSDMDSLMLYETPVVRSDLSTA